MALLTCPECRHNVSDQAEICPGCGYPVSKILAAAQSAPKQPEQTIQPEAKKPVVQIGVPSQPQNYVLSAIRVLAVVASLIFMFAGVFPETTSEIIEAIFQSVPDSKTPGPAVESAGKPEAMDVVRAELEKIQEDGEAEQKAEQKRKAQARAEINELRQYFRSNMDKVENIKWINHKKTPKFLQNKNIYTYLGDTNGTVWPRTVIGFQKTGWIFMKQIIINIDGTKYNIDVKDGERMTETVGDGTIVEYVDLQATPELEKIMWAAAHSKKCVVRFRGAQYHYDFEVSSQQKQALKHIWSYYRAKRVLGEVL